MEDDGLKLDGLVEACNFTINGRYGDCWACHCAEECPTWQGVSAERAYVYPSDPYMVITVQ